MITMKSKHRTTSGETLDYYVEAVRAWEGANRNLKHFAECCAMVDGHRTQALAQDCRVSVDTIENYRNAWELYQLCADQLGESDTHRIWEQANVSLWARAAQLKQRLELTIDKTWDYIQTAHDEGMSTRSFAAHVDEKENDTPQWIRRLRSVSRTLGKLYNDYMSELTPVKQARLKAAIDAFESELQAIARG